MTVSVVKLSLQCSQFTIFVSYIFYSSAGTSIFESFSSVSSSTTSVAVEAAEEALRQNNEAQPLEMVEGIACTIDSSM